MRTAITAILSVLATSAAAETGIASVYGNGDGFEWKCVAQQKPTGGCEIMNPGRMTAAHPTLPLGTIVTVKNRRNGKIAFVQIIDRGPYRNGRIIDLSPAAADSIDFNGLEPVDVSVAILAGGGSL